jgi:uncharacterized membrane protein
MTSLAALLSTAWLLSIVTAPLLPTAISACVYAVGSLVCHQVPDRSFHLGAYQLPICARCVGIYSGAAVGAVAMMMPAGVGFRRVKETLVSRRARWVLVGGALPTLMTVVLETAGLWPTTNAVRAGTGFPLGLAAALVVMSALATINYRDQIPR